MVRVTYGAPAESSKKNRFFKQRARLPSAVATKPLADRPRVRRPGSWAYSYRDRRQKQAPVPPPLDPAHQRGRPDARGINYSRFIERPQEGRTST